MKLATLNLTLTEIEILVQEAPCGPENLSVSRSNKLPNFDLAPSFNEENFRYASTHVLFEQH